MRQVFHLMVVLAMLSPSSQSLAVERIEDCDLLASHPEDPERERPGVPFERLDFEAAIRACEVAISAEPENPRYRFQYARALEKAVRLQDALGQYREAAEARYAAAQFALGLVMARTSSVPNSDAKALQWFRGAAEGGHPGAQYRLGLMYLSGTGASRDAEAAARWLRIAAAQGLARAQYLIGQLYQAGIGVPRDAAVAEEWFRRASVQGHGRAAILYARPKEPPASTAAAVAAPPQAPDAVAAKGPDRLRGYGQANALEAGLAAYRAADYDAALSHWRPLAERGVGRAQFYLGGLYMDGHGVAPDQVQAYVWLKRALERGYSPAGALLELLALRMTPDQIMAAIELIAE